MSGKRWPLLLVAAIVTVVILAACSSGGSLSASSEGTVGAASGASASGPAAGANSGTPIKVGAICSCSGPFGGTATAGGDLVQAWAKSVNASGGVNGRPVDLIFKDDASNPSTSVTDVQGLIADHVAAIIDQTVLDSAWQKQVDAAKIPVIGGEFTSDQYFQDPDWYPTGQTNNSILYAVASTAKAAGAASIGVLYCAEAPQCQDSVAPVQQAGKQLGVPVVYKASIAATAPNYTAQCLAAKQAGVAALFVADNAPVIVRLAQDCDRQGYTPTYVTEGTGFTMQLATTIGLKDHLWSPFPILPFFDKSSQVQAMNVVIDKYYPGLRQQAADWTEFPAQAWTGLLALTKAVSAAGVAPGDDVSAADVIRGLDTFNGDTLGGFSPPLTFAPGKAHSVDCWYTGRVQGGVPVIVNGGKLACQGASG